MDWSDSNGLNCLCGQPPGKEMRPPIPGDPWEEVSQHLSNDAPWVSIHIKVLVALEVGDSTISLWEIKWIMDYSTT